MNFLADLIPWPYRVLAVAALFAAAVGFGWIKGASHEQAKNEAAQEAQAIRIAKIETKQKATTENIDHEAGNLIDRSDAYFRGLRLKPDAMSGIPRTSGQADAGAAAGSPDPGGNPDRAECSAADGSADAIQLIELQRWVRAMQAAQNPPN